nr:MAG: RNA dependent RNA polymerase [Ustilaginoidea virens unassigned RNA virus HNND-1-A]
MTCMAGPSEEVVMSEFVPPAISDLYKHMEGFGNRNPGRVKPTTDTYAGLFSELRAVEGWTRSISGWLDPALLPKIVVPSQTSPGIRWKRLGYRTKRAALMPAVVEASRLVRRMADTGEKYEVPPAGVAGRGKRVDSCRDTGAPDRKEGRLIVMPDLVRHLLGTMAAGPYMSMVKGLDKKNGGVLLGMGPLSDSYQRIADWCKGADSFIFLDFSKFDQRLPRDLLLQVMGHIRGRFDNVPGGRAYWESECEQLIDTQIAMPDGNVYRKSQGVASGDPWTSIVDSYANWIILRRVCDVLGLRTKIWTFGDDSIIAVYGQKVGNGIIPRIAEVALREFNMQVSMEKSYASANLVDIDDDPDPHVSGSFLSLYFLQTPMGVRPTRPLQDLHEMFLVPERNRKDLRWEIVRTSMAYLVFYYNEKARYIIEEYWDWIHTRYKVPQLRGTAEDLTLLREMDIPWSAFKWEWLERLPRPGEVELLYKYGHTGFFPPSLWGAWYSKYDDDDLGNRVSLPMRTPQGSDFGGGPVN